MSMDIVFKALSDKNRRNILSLLKKGDMKVGEIQVYFKITPASLSHHLDILKRADLVRSERDGQFIIYSLNKTTFKVVKDKLLDFFN